MNPGRRTADRIEHFMSTLNPEPHAQGLVGVAYNRPYHSTYDAVFMATAMLTRYGAAVVFAMAAA